MRFVEEIADDLADRLINIFSAAMRRDETPTSVLRGSPSKTRMQDRSASKDYILFHDIFFRRAGQRARTLGVAPRTQTRWSVLVAILNLRACMYGRAPRHTILAVRESNKEGSGALPSGPQDARQKSPATPPRLSMIATLDHNLASSGFLLDLASDVWQNRRRQPGSNHAQTTSPRLASRSSGWRCPDSDEETSLCKSASPSAPYGGSTKL